MIKALISDFTDSIYMTFMREHGASLFGMSAKEFKTLKRNEPEEKVQELLDGLKFKQFNIMAKVKTSYYNDELKMDFTAIKVLPLNKINENKALLNRLEIYNNM